MKKILLLCIISLLGIGNDIFGQATCNGTDIVITNGVSGATETQHAQNTLVTQSGTSIIISNNANVSYKAGTSITLNPGFKVEAGSQFSATIETCSNAPTGDLFVTEWDAAAGESITIPTFTGETYNYQVDWSYDGITFNVEDTGVTGDISHTYASSGPHTVAIRGDFPRIYFWKTADAKSVINNEKIQKITQWGDIAWTSMERAFIFCSNLNIDANDTPDLSGVTSMKEMFRSCSSLSGHSMDNWIVSNVSDMNNLFSYSSYNEPLNSWDVSSVTNMSSMFEGSVFDKDIDTWNVSNVTDMSHMFEDSSYNRPLNSWDVSSVTNMSSMFVGSVFNNNIDTWNVISVIDMSSMFEDSSYDQPLNSWGNNLINVTNMRQMFRGSLFNKDIKDWNVSSVTDMSSMFANSSYNQSLNNWGSKLANVTNMSAMFQNSIFNQDIQNWDVSGVTSMVSMFEDSSFNENIDNWNVGNVSSMNRMFNNATSFNRNLSSWDIRKVTNMEFMFSYSGLQNNNYEAILIGWAGFVSQNPSVTQNVILGAHGMSYCTVAAENARNTLRGINNGNVPNWHFIGDSPYSCSRTLSTSEEEFKKLNVYPNPAENRLFIDITDTSIKNVEFEILDVTGRIVLKEANKNSIDISTLKSGIYILSIKGDIDRMMKFIKS